MLRIKIFIKVLDKFFVIFFAKKGAMKICQFFKFSLAAAAVNLTLSPAGLGQLAQHFFKAKLLQKLLSVKNSEN
jgi:hypothetical protein